MRIRFRPRGTRSLRLVGESPDDSLLQLVLALPDKLAGFGCRHPIHPPVADPYPPSTRIIGSALSDFTASDKGRDLTALAALPFDRGWADAGQILRTRAGPADPFARWCVVWIL